VNSHGQDGARIVGRLVLALWLTAGMRAAAVDTFLVVKVAEMNRAVGYQVMTPAEYKGLDARIQRESRLYTQAEQLAMKEWKADEGNKGIPFPGGRLSARKATVVAQFSAREQADKKIESYKDIESRRQLQEMAASRNLTPQQKKLKEAEAEKERQVEQAAELVKAKLDELLAREEEKAGGKTTPEKSDPRAPTKAEAGDAVQKAL
jgi:hypothetical protein